MSNIINKKPSPLINHPVDFAWHSSSNFSVLQTKIGNIQVPYGLSTLTSNITTPANGTTSFSIPVTDASTFVGGTGSNLSGTSFANVVSKYPIPIGTLYIYTNSSNWALIGYTVGPAGQTAISSNTFNYCFVIKGSNGGTGITFTSGTQIYDPRWVTYLLPLSAFSTTSITFDAIDSANLGLPNSNNANIVSYHWDFGNGTQADGPVVETEYWYAGQLNYSSSIAAPTQVLVSLTAVDINGNIYYVSHPIVFGQLYSSIGAEFTPGYID